MASFSPRRHLSRAVTGDCGRYAYRSSTWARASFLTCSRCRWHTRHLPRTISLTPRCERDSRKTWRRFSRWLRRRSTTPASRRRGLNSWASRRARVRIASTRPHSIEASYVSFAKLPRSSRPYVFEMRGESRIKILYRRIAAGWVWIDRLEQDLFDIGIERTIALDTGADLSAPRPRKSRQHRVEHSA